MKKGHLLIAALAVSFMLTSCNNADSLLNRYEKAVKNHKYEKAIKLAGKLDKLELTSEQEERYYDITEDML